jgi:hypothetical protein
LGTTLSVMVNSVYQSCVLSKDLNLRASFFFSPRIFKVCLATIFSAVIVESFLKFEFFSQPFIGKCLLLGAQISAAALLYFGFLYFTGEQEVVEAQLSKILKKFKKK